MPDISMCDDELCPKRQQCYRNPASGTQPNKFRQSWFLLSPMTNSGTCDYFSPIKETNERSRYPAG